MDRLFEYFKSALKGGLCSEYKNLWAKAKGDYEQLARLGMQQQAFPHLASFAYAGNGLTKDYVLDVFKPFINGYTAIDVDGADGGYKTQMWAGHDGLLYVSKADVVEMLWCNISDMSIRTGKAVKMYVACGSKVNLSCDGYNNITLLVFDESEVFLDDLDRDTNVTVFRYSDKTKVTMGKYCLANVKIHDKELRL